VTIWEHRTVTVSFEGGDWRVSFGDGDALTGLQAVLDYYGSRGWELVTVQPQAWIAGHGQFGPWDVNRLLAVFKRVAANSPSGAR
jgi:hypothetical protein